MRRAALVVLGLSLAASSAAAGPLVDPAPWVLPVNAYAKAKPGDWTLLEGEALVGGKLVREREYIRVASVKSGVAEVQLFAGPADQERWILSFPVDVKRGPDTNLMYDVPWIATDLLTTKTTCPFGTTSIPCVVVSYQTPDQMITVSMSDRVRGSGILSFEVMRGEQPVWAMKVIGYGDAKKSEWGAPPPKPAPKAAWDGPLPTVKRPGSEDATPDVYEPPPLAMPPRVDLEACQVVGDMDGTMVQRYVLRKLVVIEDCYLAAAKATPKVGGGKVDLAFGIDELSTVVDPSTAGSAPASVRACAAVGVKDLAFPPVTGGSESQVVCTFVFDPGHPAPPRKGKPKLLTRGHPARGGPDLRAASRGP